MALKVKLYESLITGPQSVRQKKQAGSSTPQVSAKNMGIVRRTKFKMKKSERSLQKLERIINQRRLRWLGHILRLDYGRLPEQAMH